MTTEYLYRHVLLFVIVYSDYGHTALYSNEIALQISFYFSHILYNKIFRSINVLLQMEDFASRAAGGSISAFLCRRETMSRQATMIIVPATTVNGNFY